MATEESDPTSQSQPQAPSNANSQTVPLSALFSPQVPEFENRQTIRESATDSEFNEVALDDETSFSPVVLTSRQSQAPSMSALVQKESNERPKSVSSIAPLTNGRSGHKKTASTLTIRSSINLPFLMARLDPQASDPKSPSANRGSVDGQLKLQEEFARLHKEKEQEEHDNTANGVSGAIDWDFWGAVISDYQQYAADNPDKLAQAIAKGIPGTLRGMMWQLMAASKDPELESQYLRLLKEPSTHEKAITRDLGRTFPHHSFFNDGQGIGQENLFNVLKAYSIYDPQVGYCQGLPFVVAILLLNMPDEEAFSLLVRLMHVYDLRGHFLPEMPKLQLRLYQFDRLVEEVLPVLHIHFLRQGVKSSMYCSQWFLTMFSYRFPMEIVFRIYDNVLASGIEAIFGFSVMLLQKNEDLLLNLKFDEILGFLNNKLFDRYMMEPEEGDEKKEPRYKVDEFVSDAVSLRITPFMLDSYSREYEDLMREVNKHAIQMDQLMNTNRSLAAQVKALETSLAELSTEHVQLMNELVKARLNNEEIERELVRYKLLYAEAMHRSDEAQSSQRLSASSILGFKRGSGASSVSR